MTVELLLGAIQTGATLVSVPPPPRGGDIGAYHEFVRNTIVDHQLRAVVARDDIAASLVRGGVTALGHSQFDNGLILGTSSNGFELVQFTSGTTGTPRAVRLDDQALGANVGALLEALRPRLGDCSVSWLPLSHDMGLIGMLWTSLVAMGPDWAGGGTILLLDPAEFLRRPGCWLDAISERRATFTAAPDFGYRLATLRRPTGSLDLRSLRCAIVGGEVIRSATMRRVQDTFGPVGLSRTALCPAYGMAEAGLAVTLTPPEESFRELSVDLNALADGYVAPTSHGSGLRAVSSGRAIAGYEVAYPVEPLRVGRISVSGPSIGAESLYGEQHDLGPGVLRTQDVGFVDVEGWLFIVGRDDDHVVVRGKNHFAPFLEGEVAELAGVRYGRVVAVTTFSGAFVVAVEPRHRTPADGLVAEIERACVRVVGARPDHVLILSKGQTPLTSSGKVRRSVARALVSSMVDLLTTS